MRLGPQAKFWLPVVAWACVISGLSTDLFSSQHTSLIILPLLHWLFPHAGVETIDLMHTVIRKIAHLTEYFILSVLLWRGLRGNDRGWQLRWAIWTVLIVACYASLDEFHQVFVPSRHASPWDALLDTAGATLGQIVVWLWYSRRGKVTGE